MSQPLAPVSDPFANLPEEIMSSILDLLDRWQDMASLASTSKPNQQLIFQTIDVMLLAVLEKLSKDKVTVSANNMASNQMSFAGYFSFEIENGNIKIPDEQTQHRMQQTYDEREREQEMFLYGEYNPLQEQIEEDVFINIGKNVRALHKYLLAKIPTLPAQQMMGVYPMNHQLERDIMRIMKLISYEKGINPNANFNYVTDLQGGANTTFVKFDNSIYKLKRDKKGKYILKDRHKLYLNSIKGKFRYIR